MDTAKQYEDFFKMYDKLCEENKPVNSEEMFAINLHVFYAVMIKHMFTAEELASDYPYLFGGLPKTYKEYGFI